MDVRLDIYEVSSFSIRITRSKTSTFNGRCSVLDRAIQEPSASTLQSLHEGFGYYIRTCPRSMSMILGEQCVRLGLAIRLEDIRRVRAMVHILCIRTQCLGYIPRVRNEAAAISV